MIDSLNIPNVMIYIRPHQKTTFSTTLRIVPTPAGFGKLINYSYFRCKHISLVQQMGELLSVEQPQK